MSCEHGIMVEATGNDESLSNTNVHDIMEIMFDIILTANDELIM